MATDKLNAELQRVNKKATDIVAAYKLTTLFNADQIKLITVLVAEGYNKGMLEVQKKRKTLLTS